METYYKTKLRTPNTTTALKNKELEFLFYNIALLHSSGIPLLSALDILRGSADSKNMKLVIQELFEGINMGKSLSEVMVARKNSQFYVSLLRIGEESGKLDTILFKIASFYKEQEEVKKRLIKTLTYPLIVLFTTSFVSFYIIFFLLPSMISLMDLSGSEPSFYIKSILVITNYVKSNTFIFIYNFALILLGLALLLVFLNSNYKIISKLNKKLLFKLWQINFLKLMNILLDSGCSIEHSLRILIDNEKNSLEKIMLEEIYKSIIAGNLLSTAIRDNSSMDLSVALFISLGEESGTVERYISLCGDTLEKRYYEKLNKYMGLIQPALLIFMAVIILTLVYSVFMPLINGIYAI